MMSLFKIKFAFFGAIFLFIISFSDLSYPSNRPALKTVEKQIPLSSKGNWYVLKYGSLAENRVVFSNNGLYVRVNKSASPLIYPLTKEPLLVKRISITGHVDKLVSIKNSNKQGQKGFDDFNLRFGLVLLGPNRLNWLAKKAAKKWIIEMYNLAPKNQGIDHIEFLNAVLSPAMLNTARVHPLSKYIKERNVWLMDKPGAFSYSHTFAKPRRVAALWISVDGDDTQSSFTLNAKQIKLEGFK